MDCSFTPTGDWFVFGPDGKTLKRGFASKALAVAWMAFHAAKAG